MFAYWVLFGIFALGAILHGQPVEKAAETSRAAEQPISAYHSPVMLALGMVLIAALVGFRYEVGGDWRTYELYFRWAGYADFDQVVARKDPAYQVLNWSVQHAGGSIWAVNLVCGAIFSWGLWRFVRVQADPWVAALIAIPYLVVVVAMGYSRQAVAIGIIMAGLAALQNGASALRLAGYICVAALFHRTAIVVLPLVILASERNLILNILAGASVFLVLYDALLADELDVLVRNYIDANYDSQGAFVRVAMNVMPAALILFAKGRLAFPPEQERVWRLFSFAALVCLVLLFVLPSTTVVDRIALYLYPLQLAVLSRIPKAFSLEAFGKFLVVLYCFFVQFVWLNYASNAEQWLPYRIFQF